MFQGVDELINSREGGVSWGFVKESAIEKLLQVLFFYWNCIHCAKLHFISLHFYFVIGIRTRKIPRTFEIFHASF